ncbi:hypothetical protein V5799_005477 [Amblyomma americanum]|uniref:Uncharacterized protein n=1 Tax=Amblyomma americanum TaxID=6943 RepID=A0AAQ4DZ52_AMBAM
MLSFQCLLNSFCSDLKGEFFRECVKNAFIFQLLAASGPWEICEFIYSDYKNCTIVDLPYEGTEQCIMFVPQEVKDDVSQECKEQFEHFCEMEVMAYDKESCSAV